MQRLELCDKQGNKKNPTIKRYRFSFIIPTQVQNRRQKVVNRGTLHLCGVSLTFIFEKNSTDVQCFIFQFGGAKPTKDCFSTPLEQRAGATRQIS